jgi:hypothetical protein
MEVESWMLQLLIVKLGWCLGETSKCCDGIANACSAHNIGIQEIAKERGASEKRNPSLFPGWRAWRYVQQPQCQWYGRGHEYLIGKEVQWGESQLSN